MLNLAIPVTSLLLGPTACFQASLGLVAPAWMLLFQIGFQAGLEVIFACLVPVSSEVLVWTGRKHMDFADHCGRFW